MHALVRFTAIMGLVSSLFDFLAFAILWLGFHAGEASFRAGWFLESMATQILVVFVIRTTLPARRSRLARTLVASASAGLLAALALGLLPVRTILGFGSLPLDALLSRWRGSCSAIWVPARSSKASRSRPSRREAAASTSAVESRV